MGCGNAGCCVAQPHRMGAGQGSFGEDAGAASSSTSDNPLMLSEEEFIARFELGRILGQGSFSVVRLALDKATQQEVAMKIVDTTRFTNAALVVEREIAALCAITHPSCARLIALCTTRHAAFTVTELARGELMLDWLRRKGRCTEAEAAVVLKGITQGVAHMHERNVVHRDLKLENLILDERRVKEGAPDLMVKIIDFGFSKVVLDGDDSALQTVCGSPQYVAPEILMKASPYTKAVDLWSLGVILYMLLSGQAPFGECCAKNAGAIRSNRSISHSFHADLASIADGTHDMLLFRKIVTAQYAMEGNLWESVSSEAKDLVRNLLQIDVEARYTTSQVLESAFIRRHCEP